MSIPLTNSSLYFNNSAWISSILSETSIYFFFPIVKPATIARSEAAIDALSAAMDPPPGAGEFEAVSSANSTIVKSLSIFPPRIIQ